MHRIPAAFVFLALTALPTWAQSVKLPTEVKGEPGVFVVVSAETDCPTLRWVALDAGLSMIPPGLLKDSKQAVVMAGRAGRYRILAYGAKGDQPSEPAISVVVLGDAPPDPGPKPPDPGPKPPTPVAGNRVLIVYETADLAAMPEKQKQVLYSPQVRDYLNARTAQDGKVKAWRVWDADVVTSGESKEWQDAMKRKRTSLPWIWINGRTVYEGPLPGTVDDAMNLLKKHLE